MSCISNLEGAGSGWTCMCATWQHVIGLAWVVGPRGILPMGQQTNRKSWNERRIWERGCNGGSVTWQWHARGVIWPHQPTPSEIESQMRFPLRNATRILGSFHAFLNIGLGYCSEQVQNQAISAAIPMGQVKKVTCRDLWLLGVDCLVDFFLFFGCCWRICWIQCGLIPW